MADDVQDAKAQKLAAARKKLKEYQQRGNNNNSHNQGTDDIVATSTTASIASNLSERSESELNLNGGQQHQQQSLQVLNTDPLFTSVGTASGLPSVASYFTHTEPEPSYNGDASNLNAIQVLIAEKSQLTTELTKCRHVCRERELELEELRTELTSSSHRLNQLQQHYSEQQRSNEQTRNHISELQPKLTQSLAQIEDQKTHIGELETQLKLLNNRITELTQQHITKCNELDMAQLRIRQLSDESSINADNRVETLTQTQFMYEQQIRDLQAMVAQLTQDKEQANSQYQNYVEHQSSELTKITERNNDLTAECDRLQERERQLIDHVNGLERDIQKNLSLQMQFKETANPQNDELSKELAQLKERASDFDFERHEFQLKIKSQQDQLETHQLQLQEKTEALTELESQLSRMQIDRPDQTKLLATMESDKVAASRALSQNMEIKQQLDELQQRFVQLTNDKAELTNRLDAEEFANREMRQNYAVMEQKLLANEERFKFKDEEMIRLSHENETLIRNELMLQQQVDRLQHYEAKAYESQGLTDDTHSPASDVTSEPEGAIEVIETCGDHIHVDTPHHDCDHAHGEPLEHTEKTPSTTASSSPPRSQLPTGEALEKLQSRFTTLISQVADLTEEKHNLEHLVTQLQGETETIGEYIALYQTQRRMLKQREYEKATQMRLLQTEREQMRQRIEMLNKLVANLGVQLPAAQSTPGGSSDQQQSAMTQLPNNQCDQNQQVNNVQPNDSQQILHKIQDIITEIKENTEQVPTAPTMSHAVDHLNCCLGKFEVV